MNGQIRVLVVDDSALIREEICDLVTSTPGMTVAGVAGDGLDALAKIGEVRPDIVTLDIQMPRMDGLETLDRILANDPVPVIVVSSLTQRAANVTFDALERGAMDYVAKPEKLQDLGDSFRKELINKIRTMAGADVLRVLEVRKTRANRPKIDTLDAVSKDSYAEYRNCCIALGISTGGPPALSRLFPTLKPPLPPLVVVQHMPAKFTGPFAARLDTLSPLTVKEATAGDVLEPNHAYVAPGGRHLGLRQKGSQTVVRIFDDLPVSGHKPSVDLMMQDAAQIFGQDCLGIIMTGMGFDGAAGCAAIRAAGGFVLGQDESSSDVYGMNKVAFVEGNVDRQVSLAELPLMIPRQCRKMFCRTPA